MKKQKQKNPTQQKNEQFTRITEESENISLEEQPCLTGRNISEQ
jgi:hypothetical protein